MSYEVVSAIVAAVFLYLFGIVVLLDIGQSLRKSWDREERRVGAWMQILSPIWPIAAGPGLVFGTAVLLVWLGKNLFKLRHPIKRLFRDALGKDR